MATFERTRAQMVAVVSPGRPAGNTHLLNARRLIARASAPASGGKSPDLTLYTIDGATGTMDPAFDAHVQPLQTWAMSWWEHWQSPDSMEAAIDDARERVIVDGQERWAKVIGPADATVAFAHRIGWRFIDGHTISCDDGSVLDCMLDPPIVIADAVKRAVRRWRLRRIADANPGLIPDEPDFIVPIRAGEGQDSNEHKVIDFPEAFGKLLGSSSTTKLFAAWQPKHRASLISAMSGGQWSQARIASVRGWATDSTCQLCKAQVGTIKHRLQCVHIRPADGWQKPPGATAAIEARIGGHRCDLLNTKGLLAIKVAVPKQKKCQGSSAWLMQPPAVVPDDAS